MFYDETEYAAFNQIHTTAVIAPSVRMGKGNLIGPGVVLMGDVVLGDNNQIRAYATIGGAPEKHGKFRTLGKVYIGSGNEISEHVNIHGSTGVVPTTIGDNCILMAFTHIGHDSRIGNGVTISAGAVLAGHCFVDDCAVIGINAALHQHSRLSKWSMLGMAAALTKGKRVIPGSIYSGVPAKYLKRNEVGLARHGISQEQLIAEIEAYRKLFPEGIE